MSHMHARVRHSFLVDRPPDVLRTLVGATTERSFCKHSLNFLPLVFYFVYLYVIIGNDPPKNLRIFIGVFLLMRKAALR